MDKHDPIKDIFAFRERTNKIFESAGEKARGESSGGWLPVVDIYETPKIIEIK